MPDHDIVVVGASAGGVEALVGLAASLPADLPRPCSWSSTCRPPGPAPCPTSCAGTARCRPRTSRTASRSEPGRIYVAPPDHHVLLRSGHVHLSRGPRENGHRPADRPAVPQRRPRVREQGDRGGPVGRARRRDGRAAGHQVARWRRRRPGPDGRALPRDAGQRARARPGRPCRRRRVDGGAPGQADSPTWPSRRPARPRPGCGWRSRWRGSHWKPSRASTRVRPSGFSCPDCNGVLWEIQDGRPGAVPLPGRPRLVAREPPHPAERGPGGGPVGRPAEPRGAGRPGQEAGRAGPPPRALHHGHPVRGAGGRGRAGGPAGPRPAAGPGQLRHRVAAAGRPPPAGGSPPSERPRRPMAEPPADRDLEVLLDYLRRTRGFDFTGYKRTSLSRRIDKRMQDVGVDGYRATWTTSRSTPRSSPSCSTPS